jgi:hypothetical protein
MMIEPNPKATSERLKLDGSHLYFLVSDGGFGNYTNRVRCRTGNENTHLRQIPALEVGQLMRRQPRLPS